MNRRNRSSIAANPILIGAATVLISVVGVFLAYNANSGLPFVPSYKVEALVPDAAELVPGNDVRIGGSRVGVVTAITALPRPSGPVTQLSLKLEKPVGPLPDDTRLAIRQRSNLGLKYVQLTLGNHRTTIPEGGTLSLRQSTGVVDLDDALSAFDSATRRATRNLVREAGTGLAGRGDDLNQILGDAPAVLSDLQAVAATLSAPQTRLRPFLRTALSATQAIAPVRERLGPLLAAAADTFAALAQERHALDATLAAGPATLRAARTTLAQARPLLRATNDLLRDAGPAIDALPTASRRLAAALATSGPVIRDVRPVANTLTRTLTDLTRVARRPTLTTSLQALALAAPPLDDALTTIVPFQTRCNYLGVWGRNVPSVVSEGDTLGSWFRFIPIVGSGQDLPIPGMPDVANADPSADTGAGGECEIGNETYLPGKHLSAQGTQPGRTQTTEKEPRGR
jgi:virulence factor Mce-like protein